MVVGHEPSCITSMLVTSQEANLAYVRAVRTELPEVWDALRQRRPRDAYFIVKSYLSERLQ